MCQTQHFHIHSLPTLLDILRSAIIATTLYRKPAILVTSDNHPFDPVVSAPLAGQDNPAPNEEIPSPVPPQTSWGAILREIAETVILALAIFLILRTVFIQNFRVEGSSMEPNFHNGQFLLVNKLSYRLGDPKRGDVIVFRYPRDPSRDFIKRVIGLPGETVEVRNNEILVNGQLIEDLATVNPANYVSSPVTVGADELFVLGDNRSNSSDSHSWGMLPMDKVIGKVILSYWPPKDWGLIRHGMTDPGYNPEGS